MNGALGQAGVADRTIELGDSVLDAGAQAPARELAGAKQTTHSAQPSLTASTASAQMAADATTRARSTAVVEDQVAAALLPAIDRCNGMPQK
jgi:hypothetical protein